MMATWVLELREISTFDAKRSVGRCVYVAFPFSLCMSTVEKGKKKRRKHGSDLPDQPMMMTITPRDVPLDPWLVLVNRLHRHHRVCSSQLYLLGIVSYVPFTVHSLDASSFDPGLG